MGRRNEVLVGSVVVIGLVLGCKKAGPGGMGMTMPPTLVRIEEAKTADVPVYIDGIGKCTALEAVVIKPRITGQIVNRYFADGDLIKKGQKLFSIDPKPAQASLLSANAQYAQAQASLEFAKLESDRYESIAGTQAVSKSDFDTKKNAVKVAEAQVAAADAAKQSAQLNLDYCEIVSPIDGRAGQALVDVGNVVKENEAELLSIQRQDPIYADFTVNEAQLADVRKNMDSATLKTLVRLPTDKDSGREGALTFLDNSVLDASGTVKLRATVPNADQHFWPGQFIHVRLILLTQKDAVLVNLSALQQSQTGPFIYAIKPDMTAEMKPVTLGQTQGELVVIKSGISSGEKVVTEGQLMLRPGATVRVAPPEAAQATTAPTTQAAMGGSK